MQSGKVLLLAGFLDIFRAIGRLTFRAIFRPKILPNGNAISSFKYWVSVDDEKPIAADGIPRYATPSQQAILGYAVLPFALMPVTFLLIYLAPEGSFALDEFSSGLAVLTWLACQFLLAAIFIPWANSTFAKIRNQRYFEPEGSKPKTLIERLYDLFNHLLGIGQQHHGLVHIEHIIVDPSIADAAHAALDEEDLLGLIHIEHRHAVNR